MAYDPAEPGLSPSLSLTNALEYIENVDQKYIV